MPGLDNSSIRTVIMGKMGAAQTWSTSFWLAGTIDPLVLDMAQISGQIRDLVHTWATTVSDYWSTDTTCVGVKCYEYPIGSIHALHESEALFGAPVVGQHSVSLLPTFCSAVNTLRTAKSGRSYRGRMYVPLTSSQLVSMGEMGAGVIAIIATATRDLLQDAKDLNLAADGLAAHYPAVASFTRGLLTQVTEVTVDSLVDVQHRREDKVGASATASETIV